MQELLCTARRRQQFSEHGGGDDQTTVLESPIERRLGGCAEPFVAAGAEATTVTFTAPIRVLTWQEVNAKFIAAVEREKVLVTMLFGIILATSSSIFIAAPILLLLGEDKLRRGQTANPDANPDAEAGAAKTP